MISLFKNALQKWLLSMQQTSVVDCVVMSMRSPDGFGHVSTAGCSPEMHALGCLLVNATASSAPAMPCRAHEQRLLQLHMTLFSNHSVQRSFRRQLQAGIRIACHRDTRFVLGLLSIAPPLAYRCLHSDTFLWVVDHCHLALLEFTRSRWCI